MDFQFQGQWIPALRGLRNIIIVIVGIVQYYCYCAILLLLSDAEFVRIVAVTAWEDNLTGAVTQLVGRWPAATPGVIAAARARVASS